MTPEVLKAKAIMLHANVVQTFTVSGRLYVPGNGCYPTIEVTHMTFRQLHQLLGY